MLLRDAPPGQFFDHIALRGIRHESFSPAAAGHSRHEFSLLEMEPLRRCLPAMVHVEYKALLIFSPEEPPHREMVDATVRRKPGSLPFLTRFAAAADRPTAAGFSSLPLARALGRE